MNILNRNSLLGFNNLYSNSAPAYRFFTVKNDSKAANQSSEDSFKQPRVDVRDLGESYELIAELPGFSKENISVTIEDSNLIIETNLSANETDDTARSIRQERFKGKYKRSFGLSEDVDQASVKAQFKDGLLTLSIQKNQTPEDATQKIEIH